MNIKVELLRKHIIDIIRFRTQDLQIDASEIADTTATTMLGEIQQVIKNQEYSDFEAIEEIVCIF